MMTVAVAVACFLGGAVLAAIVFFRAGARGGYALGFGAGFHQGTTLGHQADRGLQQELRHGRLDERPRAAWRGIG